MDSCLTGEPSAKPVVVSDTQDLHLHDVARDDETHQLVIELGTKVDEMNKKVGQAPAPAAAAAPGPPPQATLVPTAIGVFVVFILLCATLGIVVDNNKDIAKVMDMEIAAAEAASTNSRAGFAQVKKFTDNYCSGAKPSDDAFNNFDCAAAIENQVEQAGANVTKGFVGLADGDDAAAPIMTSYFAQGLCPVNVHWHLGAEHLSVGQYDEHGDGPDDAWASSTIDDDHRRLASADGVREGYQCRWYDATDSKFTTPYNWEHCVDMVVGQTYEVHWPHSKFGACMTPYQYQTPFYDGVFCGLGDGQAIVNGDVDGAFVAASVGVQAQVFTIVNDENYYYPDLIRGAIVTANDAVSGVTNMVVQGGEDTDFWSDVAYYTGSTTGTSRDNDVCAAYSPITWQVDRKCHMISASSFDKMCADMKLQADDMSDDLYAHGARELVSKELSAPQVEV